MADTKISALTAIGTLDDADLFAVVDSDVGVTKKATMAQLVNDIVHPAYCEIYISTPVETVVAAPSTPVKALGTTSLGTGLTPIRFTMPANNRLTYTGDHDMVMHIVASVSVTCASNNQTLGFCVAKNDVVYAPSAISMRISTGADVQSVSVSAAIELSTNDYVELWLENTTTAANVTIETMNFFTTGLHT